MPRAEDQNPERATHPSVDIDRLNELAWELRRTDTKRSRALGEEALGKAEAAGYGRGRAYSLLVLGYAALRSSNLPEALSQLQIALESFDTLGEREGSRHALNTLGIVYGQSGDYAGALKTFLTLQRRCAELGDIKGKADALNNTGIAYFHLGDYASALSYHLRALEAFRSLSHIEGEVQAFINMGRVSFERERFQKALEAFLHAQQQNPETDKHTRALILNHLGRTYLELEQPDQALLHNRESLTLMTDLGDRLEASYIRTDLAAVYVKLGRLEEAETYLLESLMVKRETGDTKGEAEVCLQLGEFYLRRGQAELALDTLHEGLASAQQSNAKVEVQKVHRALAEAYKRNRQFREGYLHLEKHEQLSKEVFNEASDFRLQGLRVQFEIEQTESENELYRLKNVEMAQMIEELNQLTESLRAADEEKTALLKQLERQTREDVLTGLFNRRHFDGELERAFGNAQRHGKSLSVAVCDIDHFKRVNDTFSHQMGDEVLKQVAKLLQNGVRQGDTVARYGGEEFAILLPDISAGEALSVLERIRETIESHPWRTLHPDLDVSISAGIADDLAVASHEKLVGLADIKLYEAKREGRNRVKV